MQSENGWDLSALTDSLTEVVSTWGLRVVGALALLIIGWTVCKAIRSSMRRALERSKLDPTLVPFLTKLVYYLLLTFLVLAVLSLFGGATHPAGERVHRALVGAVHSLERLKVALLCSLDCELIHRR